MNFHARNNARRATLRREVHTWLVILTVAAVVFAIFFFAPAPAGAVGYDAEQNQPSYWGDDCVKTEQALQGPRWYTPVNEGYRLVVLKSGTVNDVFYDVPADTQLSTVSGKDISHVIYCGPTPTSTTTTEAPSTTTTEAPPTTTVQPPSTTVPTTSTPVVPSTVPVPEVPVMPAPTPVPHTPAFTG